MRLRAWLDRLKPSWQQAGVLGVFSAVLLTIAWPTLNGRTASVVPSFQTATFPWAARPRGLSYLWPQSDQAESAYPWAALARRTWRSGDLPLWDPHSFGGGVPWATDGVAATFYPVRAVLDAAFLPWLAHDLFILVHLALAGAGAYWLARRWGAGLIGATVAGVGWMSNAYVWSWAPLEMVTPFFAALPLVLASTDRAVRSPTRRSTALAALILGIALVSSNLAYSVIVAATCGLYIAAVLLTRLVQARRLRDRDLGQSTGAGVVVLLLGLALSAVVLVPTLTNLARISRHPFTFEVLTSSLLVRWEDYRRVIETPESPPTADQLAVQLHVAPVVLALALIGLLFARGFGGWATRLIILVPVLIASTVQGAWVAFHLFPGFDAIRPYGRLMPLALLGVYVLAGLGVDRVAKLVSRRLPQHASWLGAVAAVAVVAAVFIPAYDVSRSLVPPPAPVADYPQYPRTPLIREIKEVDSPTGWPVRVLQTTPTYETEPVTNGALVFVGGTALVPGLDTWGGYASAVPEETSDLLRLVGGEPADAVLGEAPGPDITHPVYTSAAVDWALACRMGTDLVATPPGPAEGVVIDWGSLDETRLQPIYAGPDGQLFQLPETCAAAPHLAAEATVAESGAEAIDLLRAQGAEALRRPASDPDRPVVLDSEAAGETVSADATGRVESATRDGSTATVEVTIDGPMWLVMPVAFDDGWSASVDGRGVEVERVDFNRVGIHLEAGDHDVELAYRPPGWWVGLVVSLLGLLGLGALLVPTVRLRRRTSEETA